MRGTVIEFDEPRGLGVIRGDDGVDYAFHCTALADGSRSIDVGREVEFDLLPRLGTYEATNIA